MRIESIRLKNYRAFKDVTVKDIPEFCVIVGANGTGKSTFFDVFNFLRESLRDNVAKALSRRGGFSEVVSRGQDGPIEIELKCRISDGRLVTYFLQIFIGADKSPLLLKELLSVSSGDNGGSQELLRYEGKLAWLTANDGVKESKEPIVITSGILALKVFGYFPDKYPIANQFREFCESRALSGGTAGIDRPRLA